MALQPYVTQVPVRRNTHSFFQPQWEVGNWQEFGVNFRQMQRQMKEMEHQMKEMFQHFNRLDAVQPMQSMPALPNPQMQVENMNNLIENPIVTSSDGRQQFKMQFDVRQFRPEEIRVKTHDNMLLVMAQHQEKSPNSKSYKEYNRKFLLPQGVRPESITSALSPEGVLVVEAPVQMAIAGQPQRLVPIDYQRN